MSSVGRNRTGTLARRVVLLTGLAFTTGCLAIPLGRRQGSPPLERSSALGHKRVAQPDGALGFSPSSSGRQHL